MGASVEMPTLPSHLWRLRRLVTGAGDGIPRWARRWWWGPLDPRLLAALGGVVAKPAIAGGSLRCITPLHASIVRYATSDAKIARDCELEAAFAALERVSVTTLQRQFRDETGMTFSEWRTRARIAAAEGHLADGRNIGWTGRRVGYAPGRFHQGVPPAYRPVASGRVVYGSR